MSKLKKNTKKSRYKDYAVSVGIEINDYDEQYLRIRARTKAEAIKIATKRADEVIANLNYYEGISRITVEGAEEFDPDQHEYALSINKE